MTAGVWKRTGSLVLIVLAAILCFGTGKFVKSYHGLEQGDFLPRAKIRTAAGASFDTGCWLGSRTVVVIFLPGCKVCERTIGNLASVAPGFPGLKVALVSAGPAAGDGPFPVYVDPSGDFLRRTRKLLVPTLYLVDEAGIVRCARTGALGKAEQTELLRKFLQETGEEDFRLSEDALEISGNRRAGAEK